MKKKELEILIQKALEGNQSAYKNLLNLFWNDIYKFQFSKTKNEDEAEDITIKTFSKAFDKLHTFKTAMNFKTWLLSISKNIYIDHLRKIKGETISLNKKDTEVSKIFDKAPSPEDKLIIEQNLAQLLQHIKQLKPHYRDIIQLRYFQEYSYKEIATELNEPLSNVKIRLLRARKLLAAIINKAKK